MSHHLRKITLKLRINSIIKHASLCLTKRLIRIRKNIMIKYRMNRGKYWKQFRYNFHISHFLKKPFWRNPDKPDEIVNNRNNNKP